MACPQSSLERGSGEGAPLSDGTSFEGACSEAVRSAQDSFDEAITSIAQDFPVILVIGWSNDVSEDLERTFHRAKPLRLFRLRRRRNFLFRFPRFRPLFFLLPLLPLPTHPHTP